MDFFSFGKKRKIHRKMKKPPKELLKRCKKHHIKTTMKRGSKRVYKSVTVLKKLIKMKKKKVSKRRRSYRRSHRRSHFGLDGALFTNPADFGYNQKVVQNLPTNSQNISTITAQTNLTRPEGFSFEDASIPTYGVYADFFGAQIPKQVPPNWNFNGQPDKSLSPVGLPFQRYTSPAFGSCRRRKISRKRYNVKGSPCNKLKKRVCQSNPNCSYTRRGCRRKNGTKGGSVVYEGPSLAFGSCRRRKVRKISRKRYNVKGSPCNLRKGNCKLNSGCSWSRRGCRRVKGYRNKPSEYNFTGDEDLGAYGEAAGIQFFGRRRKTCSKPRKRYNVKGSPCNLRKSDCKINPTCSWSKRGCRRKRVSKLGVFTFGRYRRRKTGSKLRRKKLTCKPRKRYNVKGSPCNLRKSDCKINPTCSWSKRGCRRRGVSKLGVFSFGGGGCGSTLMKRNKDGKCVYKSKIAQVGSVAKNIGYYTAAVTPAALFLRKY